MAVPSRAVERTGEREEDLAPVRRRDAVGEARGPLERSDRIRRAPHAQVVEAQAEERRSKPGVVGGDERLPDPHRDLVGPERAREVAARAVEPRVLHLQVAHVGLPGAGERGVEIGEGGGGLVELAEPEQILELVEP